MPFGSPRVFLAAALLAAAACARAPEPAAPALPAARVPHVVVVSVDGLRPDALAAAPAPNLLRLAAEGAAAREARTVLPSRTLPSHASMLTGLSPAAHGITWNDDRVRREGRVGVPTVFSLLEEAGVPTAAFFGKSKLRHLILPGAPAVARGPRGDAVALAPEIVAEVEHHLRFHRPAFLFVHLSDPDLAGHGFGWMRGPYRWGVRRSDAAVERIRRAAVEAFGGRVVLIVTSDHGGHGRDHGSAAPEDVLIPWIAWGAGVAPGVVERPVSTMDTAATVLWLLGAPVPAAWEGRPVREAFGR
jgi:predicted AlkP superfamily pyrophosphatase or phosphodiesterase